MNKSFWNGKRVAVPGGGGFLGSRIVERLQAAGAEIAVPRTSEGVDFRREEDCHNYFKTTKPEIVVNCAAIQGGIGYHKGKEASLFLDNTKMGLFLMEAAQASGAKKFVNIVAGCSYPGYLEKDELNEDDYWNGEVHESIFSYGFSRKASVAYGTALKRQYGWNSIHLILANMYGPGEHFNPEQSKALAGLTKKIYDAKKSGAQTVEIWGTGKPVRDWLYVEDGAEGILRAAEVYDDVSPLNIASGVGVSVTELAEIIKRIVGYEGSFAYNTSRPDGAIKKTFGVRKMKEKLHWLPETPLEEGIRSTLSWLDANYEHAVTH
ncbi:NAD-dependent epimerase/dehydratase family protein [Candidatus Parcubacteria bacterium]|nr:MAG: NAD-dependent epimerase/dehydratase family protein [Candidatus Parcubacteria bacterium]